MSALTAFEATVFIWCLIWPTGCSGCASLANAVGVNGACVCPNGKIVYTGLEIEYEVDAHTLSLCVSVKFVFIYRNLFLPHSARFQVARRCVFDKREHCSMFARTYGQYCWRPYCDDLLSDESGM